MFVTIILYHVLVGKFNLRQLLTYYSYICHAGWISYFSVWQDSRENVRTGFFSTWDFHQKNRRELPIWVLCTCVTPLPVWGKTGPLIWLAGKCRAAAFRHVATRCVQAGGCTSTACVFIQTATSWQWRVAALRYGCSAVWRPRNGNKWAVHTGLWLRWCTSVTFCEFPSPRPDASRASRASFTFIHNIYWISKRIYWTHKHA